MTSCFIVGVTCKKVSLQNWKKEARILHRNTHYIPTYIFIFGSLQIKSPYFYFNYFREAKHSIHFL